MARITYDSGTPMGGHLKSAVAATLGLKAEFNRIQLAMDVASNADPNPRDYTKLEGSTFGAAAGQGQALYEMVTSINTLMGNVASVFLAAIDNG